MTCITALNYSLKQGMRTVPSFFLVITRILSPSVTGHFGAYFKMRKIRQRILHDTEYLSLVISGGSAAYRVDGDDAHVFEHNSF